MSFKNLFTDEGPGQPKPVPVSSKPVPASKTERPGLRPYEEGDYRKLADFIIGEGRRQGATVLPPVVITEMEEWAEMEEYDRTLFEGLFIRYGKAWVSREMARLLRENPSYRKD